MYHAMLENPRIFKTDICKFTQTARNTVNKYWKEAFKNEILFYPQLRLKMTSSAVEYVYLVKVTNPFSCLPFLRKKSVIYSCLSAGSYNLMFTSYTPIDISLIPEYKFTFLSGRRSNFIVPKVPKQSYEKAYRIIERKLKDYPEPSQISMDLPIGITWTKEEWEFYHVLKYNFRLKFTPIIKKYHISVSSFYERINKIRQQTHIIVPFYPLGQTQYMIFHILIKSSYHTFILDCFSQFPVWSIYCRIKNYVFCRIAISKWVSCERFFTLLSTFQDMGIIDDYELSIPYRSEHFQNGAPPPPPSP
jgi:hypothetical protein